MNRSRLKAQEVIHTNLQKARLTGHSVSEGGIVLDLSDMRKIEIDAGLRTAWAQTGLTAGQFTTAAAAMAWPRASAIWNPINKTQFPQALADPDLALLKVSVELAEYWDPQTSTMVQFAGLIKSIVTDEPYENGVHEVIAL